MRAEAIAKPRLNTRLWGVLACMVVGYFSFCCRQPHWMDRIGVGNMGVWFLDTRAVLAASDAHALGIPPNVLNPLDTFKLPLVYPDWWFGLHALHLTSADYAWLGASWGFAFLAVALLQLRARTPGELIWSSLVVCSPPVVFAFNRGNVDLLVFVVLSAAAACLLASPPMVRWLAPILVFVATGMKIYPAATALLILAPTRSRREVLAQTGAVALFLAGFFASETDSLARYQAVARPTGLFTYGSGIAPWVLGAPHRIELGVTLLFAAIACLYWWRRAPETPNRPDREYLRFILGTIVLTSCYFATVNYTYRLVCAIWMAPFLWTAATRPSAANPDRKLARVTAILLLVVLWLDGIACLLINTTQVLSASTVETLTRGLLLGEQPVVAALVWALLGFLVPFVRKSARWFGDRSSAPA